MAHVGASFSDIACDYLPLKPHEVLYSHDCSEDGNFIVSYVKDNGKVYFINVIEDPNASR